MDLSSSFSLDPTSLSPVSLLLLHIPLEKMTEERAEQSVHLLAAILHTKGREGGRESGRAKRRIQEIQRLFCGGTPGRKDCMSPKSAGEGGRVSGLKSVLYCSVKTTTSNILDSLKFYLIH